MGLQPWREEVADLLLAPCQSSGREAPKGSYQLDSSDL